jgi:transcription elongation factor GreA
VVGPVLKVVKTMSSSKLSIYSGRRPRVLTWSREQAGGAAATAKAAFEALLRAGALAFRLEPGLAPVRVTRFEPGASELVMIHRVAGGVVSPGDRTAMTAAGRARLEEELDRLCNVEREALAARLRDARESPGDQSDNLELLEAQHDYALLEARIAELEYALAQATVVAEAHGDLADIGSVILVEDDEGEQDRYTLVGAAEAEPRRGLISIASPVGQALLGKRAGEETTVETPVGQRRLRVLELK